LVVEDEIHLVVIESYLVELDGLHQVHFDHQILVDH
jgi:hypothetical protein